MARRSSWGGYDDFPEYVSAADRKVRAGNYARLEQEKGNALRPVQIEGRVIAKSYWGRSWCENLESYADLANRLERGRRYARNGSVIDLVVTRGRVRAKVMGSNLYFIEIAVEPLAPARWEELVERCAGEVGSVVDVLQGRLPQSLLAALADRGSGLFPSPSELELECSCPDGAYLCKHLAATLYGIGARLDREPETFFLLRGVEVTDLAARGAKSLAAASAADAGGFDASELSELFGIELGELPPPAPLPKAPEPKKRASKAPAKTGVAKVAARAKSAVKKLVSKAKTAPRKS